MGPAGERREQVVLWVLQDGVPIWPQWSLPVNGRSTPRRTSTTPTSPSGRNGGAGERREQLANPRIDLIVAYVPQWSPPVNGGGRARKVRPL